MLPTLKKPGALKYNSVKNGDNYHLIEHKGSDSWVEKILYKIKECLEGDTIPESGDSCDWCAYCNARSEIQK